MNLARLKANPSSLPGLLHPQSSPGHRWKPHASSSQVKDLQLVLDSFPTTHIQSMSKSHQICLQNICRVPPLLVLCSCLCPWHRALPPGLLYRLGHCITVYLSTFTCFCSPHSSQHHHAAAKLLQLCLTLCDPIDGSPPGSPVPGILQARTLEWAVISFSNA